jgi:hypothetical protein
MSWSEYATLAAQFAITHDYLLDVTHALHCAGSLLWFESSDELRQLIILDPQCVASAVSCFDLNSQIHSRIDACCQQHTAE